MNTTPSFIVGLVACLALVGYFGYSLVTALNTGEVTSAPVATSDIRDDLFTDPIFNELKTKSLNGPLPIVVNQADLGTGNPFQ